jgi:thiamine-monophosphate kinase
LRDTIFGGGDDYESICTVADAKLDAFRVAAQETGVAVAAVGRVREGTGAPHFFDAEGRALTFVRQSFSHF